MKNLIEIKNLVLAVSLFIIGWYNVSAQSTTFGPNTLPPSGNVGVGTNAVLYFPNVNQNKKITLYDDRGNNDNYYGFGLSDYILRYQVSDQQGNHVFYAGGNGSSNELMRIKGNGNVGIGNTNPTAKLEINGDTRMTSQLRFKNGANSLNNAKGIVWGDTNYNFTLSRIDDDYDLKILTDDNFYLGKLNADGSNGAFTLYANVNKGNVGIGNTNPTAKLEINGDTRMTSQLRFKNGANSLNNAKGIVWGDTNYGGNLSRIDDDGNLRILTDDDFYLGKLNADGSNGKFTLYANVNSGNVGIGTTTPSSRLAVNGTVTALNYALVAAMAADYVFEADYKLKTLAETEAYIKENKHLPAFKSAKHYEANGYTMTEMNIALEQTVEELTLHAIAQEKEINAMKNELAAIKAMLLTKK